MFMWPRPLSDEAAPPALFNLWLVFCYTLFLPSVASHTSASAVALAAHRPPTTLIAAQRLHATALAVAPVPGVRSSHAPTLLQPRSGRNFRPVDFGADPTGRLDSTRALQAALNALLSVGSLKPAASKLASNITDLGGATLELEGEFLISQPLLVPAFFGNFYIMRGTLRASSSFPRNGVLLTVGSVDCHPFDARGLPDGQKSCNEVPDSSLVCQRAGGLL